MRTIESLIAFYDKAEPTDSGNARVTEAITIRYAKAAAIQGALKEVYRDRLSTNDKAFNDKKEQQAPREAYYFNRGNGDGKDSKLEKAPRFKGLLSVGVLDQSNTLVVSAPEYLFTSVKEMIQRLDEAAKPVSDQYRVVKVGNGVSAEKLQAVLSGITQGTAGAGKKPEKEKTPPTDAKGKPDENASRRER